MNVPNNDQTDSDSDGFGDACDTCPSVPNPQQAGTDTDYDGSPDSCDNCPEIPNGLSYGICIAGIPGECQGDSQCDTWEGSGDGVCSMHQEDSDQDGIGDACDNCPGVPNPTQDPAACACTEDIDCPSGLECQEGICGEPCVDPSCNECQHCQNGRCVDRTVGPPPIGLLAAGASISPSCSSPASVATPGCPDYNPASGASGGGNSNPDNLAAPGPCKADCPTLGDIRVPRPQCACGSDPDYNNHEVCAGSACKNPDPSDPRSTGCTSGSCNSGYAAGEGTFELGSFKFRFGLGYLPGGYEAPTVWVHRSEPVPELSTPSTAILNISQRKHQDRFHDGHHGYIDVPGLLILTNGDYLRQVRAPQAFVDIPVPCSAFEYRIDFYNPSDILGASRDTNGIYSIPSGATPFVSWLIENPDGPRAYNRLSISEIASDGATVINRYDYAYDLDQRTWTLVQNAGQPGARIKSKTITPDATAQTTLEVMTVSEGGVELYRTGALYQWNLDPYGNFTLPIEEWAGDAPHTYKTYWHDDQCSPEHLARRGRLKSVVMPDGSWMLRDYVARYTGSWGPGWDPWTNRGDIGIEVGPWKDQPLPTIADCDDVTGLVTAGTDYQNNGYATTEYDYTSMFALGGWFHVLAGVYDYIPTFGHYPRLVTEKINSTPVRLTAHFYGMAYGTGGGEVRIEERFAVPAIGSVSTSQLLNDTESLANNLRTITKYYYNDEVYNPERNLWDVPAARIKSIQHPDGRLDTYSEPEPCTFVPGSPATIPPTPGYISGSGTDVRIRIVHGSVEHPEGYEGETTVEYIVENQVGQRLQRRVYVNPCTDPDEEDSGQLIEWTEWQYDERGRMVAVFGSDNRASTITPQDCCRTSSTVDETGIVTDTTYDAAGRPYQITRNGITTTMASEGIVGGGYARTTTRSGGGLTQSTRIEYDTAGRVTRTVDEAGLATTYDYQQTTAGGKRVVVTRPGGATEISEYYLDGRIKSRTGAAVVHEFYDYKVEADLELGALRWTRVMRGSDDPASTPFVTETAINALDQTVRQVEYYGVGATEKTTKTFFYNTKGQLAKSETRDGQGNLLVANTLYEYNEMGELIRTGLDVGGTNGLEVVSDDRIQETDSYYAQVGNDWWHITATTAYTKNEAGGAPITTMTQRQLTGLTCTGNVCQNGMVISVDAYGNAVSSQVQINRTTLEVTTTVDYPDSSVDEVEVKIDGRVQTATSKTGLTTTYLYDGLGRQWKTQDPRTQAWSEVSYNALGQLEWTKDTAGKQTTYAYYPIGDANAGRLKSIIDHLGGEQYLDYYATGQQKRTWGDTTYPVEYVYDVFGRRTELRTFRGGTWTGDTWPGGTADITTFVYGTGGLSRHLTQKVYADTTAVQYTYRPDGKLETRTWARTLPGDVPIVTTYSYHASTGEMTGIDYSDSTPDVGYTHDRLGRPQTVTDVVGTRTFTYHDPTSTWLDTEDIDPGTSGLYDHTLVKTYDNGGGLAGRPQGVAVSGVAHSVNYGYDSYGRLEQVTGTGLPAGGVSYARATNSHLSEWTRFHSDPGMGVVLATSQRAYESSRDLVGFVENRVLSTPVAKYTYHNDDLGRREGVEYFGPAFENRSSYMWDYNDRSELTSARQYTGAYADPPDPGAEVQARKRLYQYDNIGNRTERTEGTSALYYCVEQPGTGVSVNQYTCTDDASGTCPSPPTPTESFTYDADGNMTGDAEYTYEWDAENRLTAVVPRVPNYVRRKYTFVYDYMSRCVRRTAFIHNGSTWVELPTDGDQMFVYDRWNVILVLDANNSNQVVRKYTWGLDLSGQSGDGSVEGIHGAGGIGGLLAVEIPQTTGESKKYWYLYDANGNVGQLVRYQTTGGETAALAAHYDYDAYGRTLRAVDFDSGNPIATANPFRFSTKWLEDQTSANGFLYYYGHRFYSPRLGRWISRDPIEEEGGINLYLCVFNAPCSAVDPTGRAGIWEPMDPRKPMWPGGPIPAAFPRPPKPAAFGNPDGGRCALFFCRRWTEDSLGDVWSRGGSCLGHTWIEASQEGNGDGAGGPAGKVWQFPNTSKPKEAVHNEWTSCSPIGRADPNDKRCCSKLYDCLDKAIKESGHYNHPAVPGLGEPIELYVRKPLDTCHTAALRAMEKCGLVTDEMEWRKNKPWWLPEPNSPSIMLE